MALRTEMKLVRNKLRIFGRALLGEIAFYEIHDFRRTGTPDFVGGNMWLVNQERLALRLTYRVLDCVPQAIAEKVALIRCPY